MVELKPEQPETNLNQRLEWDFIPAQPHANKRSLSLDQAASFQRFLSRENITQPNKFKTFSQLCGFIAQLVEHYNGIAEFIGSNPVQWSHLKFSGVKKRQLLKLSFLLVFQLSDYGLCHLCNPPLLLYYRSHCTNSRHPGEMNEILVHTISYLSVKNSCCSRNKS